MSDYVCSICWFANGDGVSAHCGKCRCCVARPAPHHVWSDAGRRRVCTCPLAGDHNPSAWRSAQALAEVGLPVGPGRLTAYTLCQSCGAFEHAHGRCPYDD